MSKKRKFYNEPETKEEEIVEDVEDTEEETTEYDDESVEELKIEKDSELEIPEEEEESKTPEIGTVKCAKLNVRSKPSLSSEIYGVLNMNDTVIITDDSNSQFYQIEYDEKTGYVMKEFINK